MKKEGPIESCMFYGQMYRETVEALGERLGLRVLWETLVEEGWSRDQ